MSSHASVSPLERGSRPLELIEREITRLAAVIAADCCRWVGLIAEFDRREGWAQWGCHSCAVWVSWQCAVAPPAAREYVRVARRLQELPRIRVAFAAGALSYSKVRALTRVGTIEREVELLELARDATAAQLERLVRAYRGVEAVERAAAGAAPERYLRLDAADDGGVLIRGRLSAEEGALLAKALDAARAELERRHAFAETRTREDPAGPGVSAETSTHEDPAATRGERDADALVLLADTLLAHGAAARSGADRYRGCGFPGCDRHAHLHAHHIQHWVHGGATEPANLVQLCQRHHRLLHEGGYTLARRADGLEFRRPDGRVIPATPTARSDAPERRPRDTSGASAANWHRRAARPRARPRRPPHARPTSEPARTLRRGVTTTRAATADATKPDQTTPVHRTRPPLPLAVARV